MQKQKNKHTFRHKLIPFFVIPFSFFSEISSSTRNMHDRFGLSIPVSAPAAKSPHPEEPAVSDGLAGARTSAHPRQRERSNACLSDDMPAAAGGSGSPKPPTYSQGKRPVDLPSLVIPGWGGESVVSPKEAVAKGGSAFPPLEYLVPGGGCPSSVYYDVDDGFVVRIPLNPVLRCRPPVAARAPMPAHVLAQRLRHPRRTHPRVPPGLGLEGRTSSAFEPVAVPRCPHGFYHGVHQARVPHGFRPPLSAPTSHEVVASRSPEEASGVHSVTFIAGLPRVPVHREFPSKISPALDVLL